MIQTVHPTLFYFQDIKDRYIRTGFFLLGFHRISCQASLMRWCLDSVVILSRWKLLWLSLRPHVFGSCIAELRICMRYCSLPIRFSTRKPPDEKSAVVEFGRTVDPDSRGSSRGVGGSIFFAFAMALFGLPPLCDGTLKGWSGKLFGGREKNPEHTGSPCTA